MIRFLIKGLWRDRQRSLFPLLIVSVGVALTCLLHTFMVGLTDDMLRLNAILETGHVKVTTRAYAEIMAQLPNDLALLDLTETLADLRKGPSPGGMGRPDSLWGLARRAGRPGGNREQGPVFGLAVDLRGTDSGEIRRLGLDGAVVRGRLPQKPAK